MLERAIQSGLPTTFTYEVDLRQLGQHLVRPHDRQRQRHRDRAVRHADRPATSCSRSVDGRLDDSPGHRRQGRGEAVRDRVRSPAAVQHGGSRAERRVLRAGAGAHAAAGDLVLLAVGAGRRQRAAPGSRSSRRPGAAACHGRQAARRSRRSGSPAGTAGAARPPPARRRRALRDNPLRCCWRASSLLVAALAGTMTLVNRSSRRWRRTS